MKRLVRWFLSLLLTPALFAAEHHGQVRFGGLPLPGTTITASSGDKKVSVVADLQGNYAFPDLAEGTWTITVEMLCFVPEKRELVIEASGNAAAEWDLQLLAFTKIRESATQAPSLAGLPLTKAPAAYQTADLQQSKPATPPKAEAAPPSPPDAMQSADAFAINGTSNNSGLSPFAFSQAFGNFRNRGNGVYHGGFGAVMDNSALDARSFSLTGQDTPKPAYNHLQGSFNFGGPLRIPHLLRGDKTNFFFGYMLQRNRNALVQAFRVPTQAERDGNLPGNLIDASRISSQAKALLAFYPLPNFASANGYNYQTALTGNTNQDSIQTRINHTINNKNQVYGTFAWQTGSSLNRNLFAFADAGATTGWNVALNLQHRFGNRTFTHLQYQFTRLTASLMPQFANVRNVSGEAGISGNNQEPANWGPPGLVFSSGIAALTDAQRSLTRNQTHALGYDMLWTHGPHNVTIGADFRRLQFNNLSQQDPRGTFTFTGAATGNDFADFLLGIPDTSSIAYGNADKYFRQRSYDAYVTDDWRLGPTLTLNAGMRWEYNTPIVEKYGRLVNLSIGPNFSSATPVVSPVIQPDRNGFQPRVALSWRPFAGDSTVVRTGYGLYQNTGVYTAIATQMSQQFPLSNSLSIQNSADNPLTLANGFVTRSINGRTTFGIDPDFRVGIAHNWNLSVQRDLPGSLVGIVSYLGIKGTRAVQQFLPNTYPTGAVNPCPICPTGFAYMTSNGNSTREQGQVQLRRRLRSGITASVQYTYSKSIDDAALGGKGEGTAVIAQNWLDLSAERGLSVFDQRHLLTAQAQYSTGMGVRGGTLMTGWRGRLLKEWTFLSQLTAGSGLPQTPIYIAAVNGTGVTGSIRPNYTGADLYAAPAGLYLNPAAYAPPTLGQWGTAGRNSITGPNQFTLGASMSRTFRLTDRFNADFRMDSTNALNHVNFSAWNVNVTSPQFGLPLTATGMRTLQATLRVRF